jgi:hypothetical protein
MGAVLDFHHLSHTNSWNEMAMKWQQLFGIGLPFVDHFRPISGLSWNIL